MGMGPMTGRAAGYCGGYDAPGWANLGPGRVYGRYLKLYQACDIQRGEWRIEIEAYYCKRQSKTNPSKLFLSRMKGQYAKGKHTYAHPQARIFQGVLPGKFTRGSHG